MRIQQVITQTPSAKTTAMRPQAGVVNQAANTAVYSVNYDAQTAQRLAYDQPDAQHRDKLDAYRDVAQLQRRQELAELLSVDIYA